MITHNNTPWRSVGTDIQGLVELDEVLIKAGLDFYVSKAPVWFDSKYHDNNTSNSLLKIHDGNFVTYRTDTGYSFGVVGSKYEVVQNHEAFRFIELLYEEAKIKYEIAGVMNGGATMFIAVKLPESIEMGEHDIVNKYLVFSTTHDGSGSIQIVITGVRMWCGNMLQMVLKGANSRFIIKHTKNAEHKIEHARQLIKAQEKYFLELSGVLQQLKEIQVSEARIDQALAYMFLTKDEYASYLIEKYNLYDNTFLSTKRKNMLTDVRIALNDAIGQDVYQGTALWLYNGITAYLQNVREYKSEDARFTATLNNKEGAKLDHIVETLINSKP